MSSNKVFQPLTLTVPVSFEQVYVGNKVIDMEVHPKKLCKDGEQLVLSD